jgi:hypothetical protein
MVLHPLLQQSIFFLREPKRRSQGHQMRKFNLAVTAGKLDGSVRVT